MLNRLRLKFIFASLLSALFVTVVIVGIINLINYQNISNELNGMLSLVMEGNAFIDKPNGGKDRFRPNITPETEFQTRYFTVEVDGEMRARVYLDNIASVDENQAVAYTNKVYEKNSKKGFIDNYYYIVKDNSTTTTYAFLDSTQQLNALNSLFITSCFISAVSFVLVCIFAIAFSGRVVRPFVENAERQKQFITDASHELKTPISIISADAQVLALSDGENDFVKSIQNQTKRLTKLVNNMVQLTKLDEGSYDLRLEKFDLTETINDALSSYEPLYISQGKIVEKDIQNDVFLYADEPSIRQLISILLDNASKYTNDEGLIKISLSQTAATTIMRFYNTCERVERKKLDRLFDRFYRSDSSRSQIGGYGIGLSIAKSIAQINNGIINASTVDEKSICFTVIFANSKNFN